MAIPDTAGDVQAALVVLEELLLGVAVREADEQGRAVNALSELGAVRLELGDATLGRPDGPLRVPTPESQVRRGRTQAPRRIA